MTNQTDFVGIVDGMVEIARAAPGPVTIGLPCASYETASLRALVDALFDAARQKNVSIRGICCDAAMVGKLGVNRSDTYAGLLGGAPVSLRGPFDVVEFTLLGATPRVGRG